MDGRVVRLALELDRQGEEPLTGRVSNACGEQRTFSGWIGLVWALDVLRVSGYGGAAADGGARVELGGGAAAASQEGGS